MSKHSKGYENDQAYAKLSLDSANFAFLWRIEELELDFKREKGRWIRPGDKSMANDKVTFWLPPKSRKGVKKGTRSYIHRWNNGRSDATDISSSDLKEHKYSTASVFVQARQDNFLAVPFDCSRKNVTQKDKKGERGKSSDYAGWQNICFERLDRDRSGVNFGFKGGSETLICPADGTTWMPQVIPRTYNPSIYAPEGYNLPRPGDGGLCGELSLLVALAALSVKPGMATSVVSQCFTNGKWLDHKQDTGSGRYEYRGIVASIWLDPSSTTTGAHLKAWESGRFGAIFGPALGAEAGTGNQYSAPRSSASTSAIPLRQSSSYTSNEYYSYFGQNTQQSQWPSESSSYSTESRPRALAADESEYESSDEEDYTSDEGVPAYSGR